METKSTMNYEWFKFWRGNRVVLPKVAEKLKRSILMMDLTPARPILVNKSGYIIDGQHRFVVCQELQMPIYYTVVDIPDNQIDEYIRILNTTQKNWGMPDYLNYFCERGYKNYLGLRNFMRYHNIPINYLGAATWVYNDCGSDGGCTTSKFKTGELGEKWERADEVMQILLGLPIKHNLQRSFVLAFKRACKEFSAKDVKKIVKNIVSIPAMLNVTDYMFAFNNIILRK